MVPTLLLQSMSLGRERVCGEIFQVSGASLTCGGSLGVSGGTCIPTGDCGIMSAPTQYPGSLGSLFSSQGSWEDLQRVRLRPSLFPRKGGDH